MRNHNYRPHGRNYRANKNRNQQTEPVITESTLGATFPRERETNVKRERPTIPPREHKAQWLVWANSVMTDCSDQDVKLQKYIQWWKRMFGRSCTNPFTVTRVIYYVLHIPSGEKYIGETSLNVVDRFMKHYEDAMAARPEAGRSGLSNRMDQDPVLTHYMILPIEHQGNDQERKAREAQCIKTYACTLNFHTTTLSKKHKYRLPSRYRGLQGGETAGRSPVVIEETRNYKLLQKVIAAGETKAGKELLSEIGIRRALLIGDMTTVKWIKKYVRERRSKELMAKPQLTFTLLHKNIDAALLRAALQKASKGKKLPWTDDYQIKTKLSPSLHRFINNCPSVANSLEAHQPCTCDQFPELPKWEGHVVAPASEIFLKSKLKNLQLESLAKAGMKFRFWSSPSMAVESMTGAIEDAVKNWTTKMQVRYKDEIPSFVQEAKMEVERIVRGMYPDLVDPEMIGSADTKKSLEEAKKHFVFMSADKSPQTIIGVCQQYYVEKIKERLDKYQDGEEHETRQAISMFHKLEDKFLSGQQRCKSCLMPYLYLAPKMHKNKENQWREIVGTSVKGVSLEEEEPPAQSEGDTESDNDKDNVDVDEDTTTLYNYTANVSTYVAHALEACLDQMQWKSKELFEEKGIKHFFALRQLQALPTLMDDSLRKTTFVKTDFSNMYTAVDQKQMIRVLQKWIPKIYEFAYDRLIAMGVKPDDMDVPDLRLRVEPFTPLKEHTFTFEKPGLLATELIQLATKIVTDSYFVNGNKIKKQSGGISIGANAGQQLANLLCAATEWENSERILADAKTLERVKSIANGLKHVYRVVDDRIAPEEAVQFLPTAEQYGLDLSEYEEGPIVTFAGYRIESTSTTCVIDLADKQEKINFLITRYPHANSNLPVSTIIGSLVGLFISIRRSTRDEIKMEETIHHYISSLKTYRGYPYAWFHKAINKLYSGAWDENPTKRLKTKQTFQKVLKGVFKETPYDYEVHGIVNLKSTCHLNAAITQLYAVFSRCSGLHDMIKQTTTGSMMLNILKAVDNKKQTQEVKTLMNHLWPKIIDVHTVQMDTQHTRCLLIDQITVELPLRVRQSFLDVFEMDFIGFQYCSCYTQKSSRCNCTKVYTIPKHVEHFARLNVEARKQEPIVLSQRMSEYLTNRVEEHVITCDCGHQHKNAKAKFELQRLPSVIFVDINRKIIFDKPASKRKVYVDRKFAVTCKQEVGVYEIVNTSTFSGTDAEGHVVSTLQLEGEWFAINDRHVENADALAEDWQRLYDPENVICCTYVRIDKAMEVKIDQTLDIEDVDERVLQSNAILQSNNEVQQNNTVEQPVVSMPRQDSTPRRNDEQEEHNVVEQPAVSAPRQESTPRRNE
eukprot:PhF_6_TR15904/c2_g1_i2/m.24518